jgi:hypothetical protein
MEKEGGGKSVGLSSFLTATLTDYGGAGTLRRAAREGESCGASLWLSGVGGKCCEGGVSWGLGFYRRASSAADGRAR